eukprot:9472710-Pyramimonas_sp.AAC.1
MSFSTPPGRQQTQQRQQVAHLFSLVKLSDDVIAETAETRERQPRQQGPQGQQRQPGPSSSP